MSTFNGIVSEFPDIRIDYFRRIADEPPPLACFLSHVHSDHLAGLESLRSPFVYCSAATREILLRLERYPCRINFAKGILEARVQTFKNLKKLLKPIPLETPTELELKPKHSIQVTLFDANHCPGAVMFLVEDGAHAILYTGDIRSEPWFVNSIGRNPCLVEYTHGIKTLDKVYLDTSFTDNLPFQTKAEGIAELLGKVKKYPAETIFHFQAWTFGYEDVWLALSRALNTKIHVDQYKMSIYASLRAKSPADRFGASAHACPEAPALTGYMCGNTSHPGCLTTDQNVRLHSCEKGNYCSVVRNGPVVWIRPIIAHLTGGVDRLEVGVGGGGDDLEREAELASLSAGDLEKLCDLILGSENARRPTPGFEKSKLLDLLSSHGRNVSLDLDISMFSDQNEASLEDALACFTKRIQFQMDSERSPVDQQSRSALPSIIHFPYSRHSSYPELCHLIDSFKPRDIWPCTVDPAQWREAGISIASLFGRYCIGDVFSHDQEMELRFRKEGITEHSQQQQTTQSHSCTETWSDDLETPKQDRHKRRRLGSEESVGVLTSEGKQDQQQSMTVIDRDTVEADFAHSHSPAAAVDAAACDSQTSIVTHICGHASLERIDAHSAVMRNLSGEEWTTLELISTRGRHTDSENEFF